MSAGFAGFVVDGVPSAKRGSIQSADTIACHSLRDPLCPNLSATIASPRRTGLRRRTYDTIECTRLNRTVREIAPSMQMFRAPRAAGGGDASVIVTSDYRAAAWPSKAYARAQLAALEQKFTGFRLLSLGEFVVDGVSAAVIDYEWSSNDDLLRQRQAYVPSPRCMFTLSLTARAGGFPQLEAAWDLIVGSISLHKDGLITRNF